MAKENKGKGVDTILENTEILNKRLVGIEHWFENHPKTSFSIIGIIVLILGAFFGGRYYLSTESEKAQSEIFQAIRYFEADSLKLALEGDGINIGFLQAIDDYPWTDAAKLSHFYTGFIYLKQGKFEEAIDHLKKYKADDLLVQPRAYSLIGDAYMELGRFDEAANYYDRASSYKPTKTFTPIYLLKAALAFEKQNNTEKAIKAYQTILEKFPDAPEAQTAKREKARLETNS